MNKNWILAAFLSLTPELLINTSQNQKLHPDYREAMNSAKDITSKGPHMLSEQQARQYKAHY